MGIKFSQLPVFEQPTPGDYLAVLDSTASILKRSSITNLIAKNLGQIETSATAAYVHVEGEYFMFMNQFVKCTVDISVSDTIAIGTNVTAANVADALNQISGGLAGGTFVGTAYEWSQLTDAQKDKYILVNITDDDPYLIGGHDISGIGDGTVSGALVQLNSDLGAKSSASSVTGNNAFAKINTLGTDLGAKSSASAVTGDDAFAKIATLNSDLMYIQSKVVSVTAASGGWTTKVVTFDNAYSEPPLVSVYQNGNVTYPNAIRLGAVTSTNCAFYIHNEQSSSVTQDYVVQSIGKFH